LTFSVNVDVCVRFPEVPVTVTVYVPAGVPVGGGGGGGWLEPPPQPIAWSIRNRTRTAKGSAPARRWRRVRANRINTSARTKEIASSVIHSGRSRNLPAGKPGGASPRDVVVTITEEVPLPVAKELGLTVQVVAVAATGSEQIKPT
jgi:hypothetical protein